MAAAVVAGNAPARPSGGLIGLCVVPLTITLVATAYATATGGFAFDLAALLNAVGPFDSGINPNDVFFFVGGSALGYRADQFVGGTATFTTSSDTSFNTTTALATFPCKMRLWNGITEIGDGNITQTITGHLFVARGGRN